MKAFSLTAEEFRSLATGYGSAGAVAVLVSSQRAKRRLALRVVVEAAARAGGPYPKVMEAVALLQAAEATRPDAVRTVLAHPHVDVWAADCMAALTALSGSDARAGDPAWARAEASVGYLGAVAAAAAARSGMRFTVRLPNPSGVLVLPTLGAASGLTGPVVTVRGDESGLRFQTEAGTVQVAAPFAGETRHWQPVRYVTAVARGQSHTLAIEDLDPYRDCCQWRPMDRMNGADAGRLSRLYHAAWGILVDDYPEHAAGIKASLTALVPLSSARPDRTVSATSSRAFGSLGVSLPEDPTVLALLLIHEFQHMKLSALLDLVDLCRPGDKARLFAPWRPDPRPAPALLQGVYAHVGVVDFWRRRRHLSGGSATRIADFEFALWRRQTAEAAASLLRSGSLTDLGMRFVTRLAETLTAWQRESVPAATENAASDVGVAATVWWRLRHWAPPAEDVRRLVDAIRSDRPCPPLADPTAIVDARPGTRGGADLGPLIRARVTGGATRRPGTAADAAYLEGRFEDAVRGYAVQIQQGHVDGWVGLALGLGRLRRAGANAVVLRPDVLHRVHAELDTGIAPVHLAEWLEPAVTPS